MGDRTQGPAVPTHVLFSASVTTGLIRRETVGRPLGSPGGQVGPGSPPTALGFSNYVHDARSPTSPSVLIDSGLLTQSVVSIETQSGFPLPLCRFQCTVVQPGPEGLVEGGEGYEEDLV